MLKQKFFVQFGSKFLIKIVGMVAGIIVARIGGPEVVGVLAYGTAYVSIFGFLTGLFGTSHIKIFNEVENKGDAVTTFLWLKTFSISVYFLVVLSWFLAQTYLYNYEFGVPEQKKVILLSLCAVIIAHSLQFHKTVFNADLKIAISNIPGFIKDIIWHLGRIAVVLLGFKAIGLATWNLITSVGVFFGVLYFFRQLPKGKFDKTIFKKHLTVGIPVFGIVVINSLTSHSDKLLLGHFTSTEELGYFSAANSIGGMFMMVSMTVGTIFYPLFSKYIAQNNWDVLNNKLTYFQEFITIFLFPLACMLPFISEFLLITLLGDRYIPSVIPFNVLIFATYIVIVGMPYGNIIIGMGQFYLNLWINIIKMLVFFVGIYFMLSPQFLGLGASGVALNLLIFHGIGNLLYLYYSKKIGHVKIFYRNIIRYLLIIFPSVILYYSRDFFEITRLFECVIFIFAYLIFVYTLLFLTGFVQKKHFNQLMELLNLSALWKYITLEIKG